jgi:hypothetical protein
MERVRLAGGSVSLTVPIKIPVADFAPIQGNHPEASRSSIIRAILYACAASSEGLVVAGFEPPKLAAWTTISIDPVTEVILQHSLARYNVSSISGLLYAAVRDPSIVEAANKFLRRHPVEQKRFAKALSFKVTGVETSDPDEDEVKDTVQAHKRLSAYLKAEVERTRAILDAAMRDHVAAKGALDAYILAFNSSEEEPS